MRRYADMRHAAPHWSWGEAISAAVLFVGIAALVIFAALLIVPAAHATWKPEYGKAPRAVQDWFKAQQVMPAARHRLNGLVGCCENTERLMTKFEPTGDHEWAYYPNPACTVKGCPLLPIPNDIVHDEPIRMHEAADDNLPEVKEMRQQGVIFIWQGKPTCFWPPEGGI